MQATLYNQEGKEVGSLELDDAVFGADWNPALVKQVVEAEQSNRRTPYAHTKDRAEVRGGGKKPWKQKGTGRARAGSTRSPLWKGGGTTFGPRNERSFTKKINKQMKRKALFAVLSAKLRDGECVFVDGLALVAPKTKEMVKVLANFPAISGRSMALVSPGNKELERAARNIKNLSIFSAKGLNAFDILQKKHLLILKESADLINKTFLKS
jgi:large subunit ribosomal protein L4